MVRTLTLSLVAFLLSTTQAHAVFIFNGVSVVTGGGLIAPNANYGCPAGSADCLVSHDYELVGTASASGTLMDGYQNGVLPEGIQIDLFVPSATFASTTGGPDLVFTDVSYDAFVPNQPLSLIQNGPGTGTVTGFLNGTPFSTTSGVYNTVCVSTGAPVLGGQAGQCGLAFGPQLFTAGGENWLQTFNLTTGPGPEPADASLVLLGLAGLTGLALRRRS